MLVLTRKLNQSIQIGDDITITVHRIHRDMVRIAIQAPMHVAVDRAEVRVKKTKEGASGVD